MLVCLFTTFEDTLSKIHAVGEFLKPDQDLISGQQVVSMRFISNHACFSSLIEARYRASRSFNPYLLGSG